MKRIISLMLALAMLLAFSSCNKDTGTHSLAKAAEAMKVGYAHTKQEGYAEFIEKLDAFAAKLTYEVYADSNKQSNLCISPVSVYMALALATECASGETRDEILNAVGVTYSEVKNFTKVLYALANSKYYSKDKLDNKQPFAFLELANSIWVDNNVTLKEEGINSLAGNYNCDLFSTSFKTGEADEVINAYIKEKTHGIIDSDIKFSRYTLFTLINTLYLKEVWNEGGNKLKFTDKTYGFKNADGSVTDTKLLQGYYFNGKAYEGDGYTSFFTRTENGLYIKFILPTDGHTISDVFTADNVYRITGIDDYGYMDRENMIMHHTRVLFPEYKASFDDDLADILKNDFGINDMFYPSECDFSNVTDETVACSGVLHKCGIEVDAGGIEGAAVTVIPMAGASEPDQNYKQVYHNYTVDRAFGFVITDSYGTVLFSGVINNVN